MALNFEEMIKKPFKEKLEDPAFWFILLCGYFSILFIFGMIKCLCFKKRRKASAPIVPPRTLPPIVPPRTLPPTPVQSSPIQRNPDLSQIVQPPTQTETEDDIYGTAADYLPKKYQAGEWENLHIEGSCENQTYPTLPIDEEGQLNEWSPIPIDNLKLEYDGTFNRKTAPVEKYYEHVENNYAKYSENMAERINMYKLDFNVTRQNYYTEEEWASLSDPHGDLAKFLKLLFQNNIIDEYHNWLKGRNFILIIIGDVNSRGPYVIELWAYIGHLQFRARERGSDVCALAGNHEEMFCQGYGRFLNYKSNPIIFRIFDKINDSSIDLTDEENQLFKAVVNLLANLPAMYQIGEFVFAHAGISEKYVNNIKEMNTRLSDYRKNKEIDSNNVDEELIKFCGHDNPGLTPLWNYMMIYKSLYVINPHIDNVMNEIAKKSRIRWVIVGHTHTKGHSLPFWKYYEEKNMGFIGVDVKTSAWMDNLRLAQGTPEYEERSQYVKKLGDSADSCLSFAKTINKRTAMCFIEIKNYMPKITLHIVDKYGDPWKLPFYKNDPVSENLSSVDKDEKLIRDIENFKKDCQENLKKFNTVPGRLTYYY